MPTLIRPAGRLAAAGLLLTVAACAQPLEPHVAVMPAPNKPYAVFADDDVLCRHYAEQQVGGPDAAHKGSNDTLLGAGIGTLAGAALGALLSAHSGGTGAAAGAAIGLAGGTAIGAGNGQEAQYAVQRRYDIAYQQCMYAKGNQVPGFAAAGTPPPPPGAPPPAPAPSYGGGYGGGGPGAPPGVPAIPPPGTPPPPPAS